MIQECRILGAALSFFEWICPFVVMVAGSFAMHLPADFSFPIFMSIRVVKIPHKISFSDGSMQDSPANRATTVITRRVYDQSQPATRSVSLD